MVPRLLLISTAGLTSPGNQTILSYHLGVPLLGQYQGHIVEAHLFLPGSRDCVWKLEARHKANASSRSIRPMFRATSVGEKC
jgi:hypothetical protein